MHFLHTKASKGVYLPAEMDSHSPMNPTYVPQSKPVPYFVAWREVILFSSHNYSDALRNVLITLGNNTGSISSTKLNYASIG